MSAADHVVATWVQSAGCGTQYEDLTADGQVHLDCAPPLGEPYFEGDVACGQCREPHVWPPLRNWVPTTPAPALP